MQFALTVFCAGALAYLVAGFFILMLLAHEGAFWRLSRGFAWVIAVAVIIAWPAAPLLLRPAAEERRPR